jgi:O-antigen ligase
MNVFSLYLKPVPLLILVLLAVYLINPLGQGYLAGYLIAALILVNGNFMLENLDIDLLLLLLYSITYAMFYSFDYESQGKQFIAIYAIMPPIFYLVGKFLAKDNPKPEILFYILFGIALLFSLSALISVFQNFLAGGFLQMERSVPFFWGGKPVSATIMGAFFTLNMCIPALLILSKGKKGLIFNAIAIAIFIMSLICVLRLGSRTQLGIFLITTIFSFFYMLPKQSTKQNILLISVLGLVVFYISTKVSFSLNADWLTTYSDRMDSSGGNIASGGGRTERWVKSFEYLFKYPLGWDVKEFGYSHNLWLDVLRAVGIIPFFILIIYSVRSVIQVLKTTKLNKKASDFNGQIIVYFLAFFALFMVEPVMEGIFGSFVLFCLFKGVINKYYTNELVNTA